MAKVTQFERDMVKHDNDPGKPPSYCIRGAIIEAAGWDSKSLIAYQRIALAENAAARALPDGGGDWIVGYNNHPATTAEDIIRVLDKALELPL